MEKKSLDKQALVAVLSTHLKLKTFVHLKIEVTGRQPDRRHNGEKAHIP
jgi:hypothetical protein